MSLLSQALAAVVSQINDSLTKREQLSFELEKMPEDPPYEDFGIGPRASKITEYRAKSEELSRLGSALVTLGHASFFDVPEAAPWNKGSNS